jgi:hypothetical protein
MVLAAWATPLLALKLIRVQLIPSFGEDKHDDSKDGGYEVG